MLQRFSRTMRQIQDAAARVAVAEIGVFVARAVRRSDDNYKGARKLYISFQNHWLAAEAKSGCLLDGRRQTDSSLRSE
jgi:hypothetical protein